MLTFSFHFSYLSFLLNNPVSSGQRYRERSFLRQILEGFFQKRLDNSIALLYNVKAVWNAAIAQPVERILGKDEVASSNLASSSKEPEIYGFRALFVL